MKDPRDPRNWENTEIEQDAAGYVAAQQAFAEDRDAEHARKRERDALASFTEEFVRNGGKRSDARAAWQKLRNERASEAAERADEEARRFTKLEARRVI